MLSPEDTDLSDFYGLHEKIVQAYFTDLGYSVVQIARDGFPTVVLDDTDTGRVMYRTVGDVVVWAKIG